MTSRLPARPRKWQLLHGLCRSCWSKRPKVLPLRNILYPLARMLYICTTSTVFKSLRGWVGLKNGPSKNREEIQENYKLCSFFKNFKALWIVVVSKEGSVLDVCNVSSYFIAIPQKCRRVIQSTTKMLCYNRILSEEGCLKNVLPTFAL